MFDDPKKELQRLEDELLKFEQKDDDFEKFYQDIFRLPDMKCVMKAVVDTVCLVNGRLGTCDELDQKLTYHE